jgi:hypothetical protein
MVAKLNDVESGYTIIFFKAIIHRYSVYLRDKLSTGNFVKVIVFPLIA